MPALEILIAFATGAATAAVLATLLYRAIGKREADAARVQSQFARERIDDLQGRLAVADASLADRDVRLREANTDLTKLRVEAATFAERLEELGRAHAKLGETFQALSAEALRHNAESFLQLARREFERLQQASEGEFTKREDAIGAMLAPIREGLHEYDAKLQQIEKQRTQSYGELTTQLKTVSEASEKLRGETATLAGALKSSHVRGQWGEIQLQRCCELAGMLPYCDFRTQQSVETDDGRLRPDLTVTLPGGKTIVVDAKTPLTAYMEAVACEDPNQRRALLKTYAAAVRGHVDALGKKAYWEQFDQTPEFVVMFLPAEPFLSAAVEGDPAILEQAIASRIIIATPMSVIAVLKAIALTWRQERIAEDAEQISKLGKELYVRLRKFARYTSDVGTHLGRTVKAYNRTVGSLEGRVLVSARRFNTLGVATGDEIPEPASVDMLPRMLSTDEAEVESPETSLVAPD